MKHIWVVLSLLFYHSNMSGQTQIYVAKNKFDIDEYIEMNVTNGNYVGTYYGTCKNVDGKIYYYMAPMSNLTVIEGGSVIQTY